MAAVALRRIFCISFVTLFCLLNGSFQSALPPTFQLAARDGNSSRTSVTYSLPMTVDPLIFNLPQNTTVQFIPSTQLQGQVFLPQKLPKNHSTPLVILLSGRHADCRRFFPTGDPIIPVYPLDDQPIYGNGSCAVNTVPVRGYRGFDYLGEDLANEGFLTISIDPMLLNNALPVDDVDADFIAARARLIFRTLELVRTWDTDAQKSSKELGVDISGVVDFGNIGLMGHSRGGNAVRQAYEILHNSSSIPEIRDWNAALKVSIAGVFEVASYDESNKQPAINAVGVPWGMLLAGCDSEIIDNSGLRVVQRQIKQNAWPNHFLSLYGADHSYFNTEWPLSVDVCLGDQTPLLDRSNKTIPIKFGETVVNLPLNTKSKLQQDSLKWALKAFMKAYVGSNASRSYAQVLLPDGQLSSNFSLVPGVEIGRTDPNLGGSQLLESFQNLDSITTSPNNLKVQTIATHATESFPDYQSQVQADGYPPILLPPLSSTTMLPQLSNAIPAEQGAVVSLAAPNVTVQIKINSPPAATPDSASCRLQIDVARRDTCFLSSPVADRRNCSRPRYFSIKFKAGDQESPPSTLKSRFNVEWGPATAWKRDQLNQQVLLPVFWETMTVPCPSTNVSMVSLEVTSVGYNDPGSNPSFLYLGALRQATANRSS